jgi:hypothetical protein
MPYPQRRCTDAIEFRERKQQYRVCSVPERLFMVAACREERAGARAALGARKTGGRWRCVGETGWGSREEAGRAGAAHRHAWQCWDSGWTGAHGAALSDGRVQHRDSAQQGCDAGEGAGRCRNTRRKAHCRGTAAAVQRRMEEEDAWDSRADLERSALRADGHAAVGKTGAEKMRPRVT